MIRERASQGDRQPAARVFISYSRKDMAFAERLEAALKARGIEPLIDRSEIYAFEDWWKRIEALIAHADTIVMVLSPDAISSDVCKKEVAFAASLNKRFAPIVCRRVDDKAVPETLARLNFIFFDDDAQFDESANRLAEALATNIEWIRKHTQFGEVAHRWSPDGRAGARGLLLRSPVLEEAEHWIASRPQDAPEPTETTRAFILDSRRGATRRRNILTTSLAAGLVLALGLSGLAYWQRGIAIEQRGIAKSEATRAERNFGAAKSTVDAVIFDLAQGLQDVEGMRADTMRRILERAESAVGQLASRTENDPKVRHSQVAMFQLFSETYLKLGFTQLAADHARKATDLARALSAEDPGNVEWQHDVFMSMATIGNVLWAQGDLPGSLTAHRESLDIARALAAKDPDNTKWQADIALSLGMVGNVLMDQGNFIGALAAYREGLDLARALAVKDAGNAKWQREVSAKLSEVGDVLVALNDLPAALTAYREGVDIARALAAKDLGDTQRRRDVSISLEKVGDVLMAQGDRPGALAAYREGLDMARALAAKDTGNTRWQRDVSVGLNKVGYVLWAQRDLPATLAAFRESLDMRRALAAQDPDNTEWQRDVSGSLDNIGNVLVLQGERTGALTVYRESLDIARMLAGKDPSKVELQMDVIVTLRNLALAGDDPRARWSEALAILTQLNSEGRLAPAQQGRIAIIEAELANPAQPAVPRAPPSTANATEIFSHGNFRIRYDNNKWVFQPEPDGTKGKFILRGEDAQAIVIPEGFAAPTTALKKIATDNLRKVASHTNIVKEELRKVNGSDVLFMKVDATVNEIPFTYYYYLYGDKIGVIQLMAFTTPDKQEKHEPDIFGLLNGLQAIR